MTFDNFKYQSNSQIADFHVFLDTVRAWLIYRQASISGQDWLFAEVMQSVVITTTSSSSWKSKGKEGTPFHDVISVDFA